MSLADLFGGTTWTPLPPPPVYLNLPEPTFESDPTSTLPNGYISHCNPIQYATMATAQLMASTFGASFIVEADPKASAFPATSPSPARLLQFVPGCKILNPFYGTPIVIQVPFSVNAGETADNFLRMPESQFSDMVFGSLARRYAWNQIYQAWQLAGGR